MNKDEIETALKLIVSMVGANHSLTWQKKRAAVLAECSEDDKIALYEFSSWFRGRESIWI